MVGKSRTAPGKITFIGAPAVGFPVICNRVTAAMTVGKVTVKLSPRTTDFEHSQRQRGKHRLRADR